MPSPLFIIGEQRSGSNLLRLMLNQAGIAAPHPPHILTRFIPIEGSYGDLHYDESWDHLVDDICTLVDRNPVPWSEVSPLDRDEVKQRCRERSTVAAFGAVMDMYAEARGVNMWACKSMQYSKYVEAIEAYFRAPRYIYLFRDGRDVTLSFKRAVIGDKHPYFIAKKWAELQDAAAYVQDVVGTHRCFSLCYEELTAEPEPVLRALCDFLGVPFQASMMDFHRSQDAKAAAGRSQLWQNVGQPLMRNNSRKFLTGLTATEIEIVESVAGPALDRLGYERVQVKPGEERVFSAEEVRAFADENAAMKAERSSAMDAEDATRRANQLNVLTARLKHLQDIPKHLTLPLLEYLVEMQIGPGEVLLEKDEVADAIFFVIDGSISVEEEGRVIASIPPGECIGEIAVLANTTRTRQVRAQTTTRLFVLHRETLEQLMLENPALAVHIFRALSTSLARRFVELLQAGNS